VSNQSAFRDWLLDWSYCLPERAMRELESIFGDYIVPASQRCPHGYSLANLKDGTDTCEPCSSAGARAFEIRVADGVAAAVASFVTECDHGVSLHEGCDKCPALETPVVPDGDRCDRCGIWLPPVAEWSMPSCPDCVEAFEADELKPPLDKPHRHF
jgi:hypothetical protein